MGHTNNKSNKADGHTEEHDNREEAINQEGVKKAIEVEGKSKEEIGEELKFGEQESTANEEETPLPKEAKEQKSSVSEEPAGKEEQPSLGNLKDNPKAPELVEEDQAPNKQTEEQKPEDDGDIIEDSEPNLDRPAKSEPQKVSSPNDATEEEKQELEDKQLFQGGSSEPDQMIGHNRVRAYQSKQYN